MGETAVKMSRGAPSQDRRCDSRRGGRGFGGTNAPDNVNMYLRSVLSALLRLGTHNSVSSVIVSDNKESSSSCVDSFKSYTKIAFYYFF